MRTFLVIFIVAIAAASGWWLGVQHSSPAASTSASAARKVLYYQSPMHPYVKSDRPGKCTVCGMELVPIYEGSAHAEQPTTDVVILPEGSPAISGIRTVEVKKQPLARTLRVAGMIDDDESKHRVLSAYSGGRIEKLFVNFEGAEVKAGQPLASYYSKELLNAVREYKVAFKQGPSPLLTATEMRLRQLGMSEQQVAAAPQRSEKEIFVEILAPNTGTVVKRYVYEGQYVQEGEKLFEIADFSTMWFQFIAYEQDLPFLKKGLPVAITTSSLPGRTLNSKITFINPNLDGMTRSARVRVEFENPKSEHGLHGSHEMLHKLYADAVVTLEAPEVVTVPRNAVLWTGSDPRIYVEQSPGSYQQRRIILGRPGDDVWEVLEGVRPGERVVASGNMLIDGQAQINNLAAPSETAAVASDLPIEMTAAQHETVRTYLTAVAAVTESLAADNLAAYNSARAAVPPAPEGLEAKIPEAAADLATARRQFLPVSQAVADFGLRVRGHFDQLRVFRCPMSEMIGGGAPENAKWIQFTPTLRNPYMGHEMISCGVEIK